MSGNSFNTNLFNLEGDIVVLTGASGWLGLAICSDLLSAGAKVWAVSKNATKSEGLELLKGKFLENLIVEDVDISEQQQISGLISKITAQDTYVTGLVNNAYSSGNRIFSDQNSPEYFDSSMRNGIYGSLALTEGLRELLKSGSQIHGNSSVVNISSMYGKVAPYPSVYAATGQQPNPLEYGVLKAGVIQATKWFAVNFAAEKIRVNSISPGPFPSDSTVESNPAFISELVSHVPMGRIGRPEEITGTVIFLLSKASSYVTGQDIGVDGGWTAW